MTVNYTTNLALGQPVTGTESGTWGDDVNNSVTSYLDIAIAGGLAITVTTADVTLTLTQGTSSATNIGSTTAQYAILNVSGAMTAARNLILPSSSRVYVINNNTTGGYALTVKGSATSGVTMVNGESAHIYWNGSDYAKAANTAGVATFTNLTYTGTLTGSTGVIAIGTNQIYKDSSGNVGIGNTSPGYRLDISAADTTASVGYAMRLRSNATATAATIQFTNSSASSQNGVITVTDAGLMSFSGAVYINSSGNVGIATSSPATGPRLTVQGGGVNGYGGIRLLSDTLYSNGANYVAYGRRGDGNPSGAFAPGVLLARVNTAPAALISGINLGRVAFGGSYDGTDANVVYGAQIAGYSSGTYSSTSAATDLLFFTTPSGTAGGTTTGTADFGTERMRIDSSGNVGIGTTSMIGKLNVTGTAAGVSAYFTDAVNSSLVIRNAVGGVVLGTDSGGIIRFATNGNATTDEKMRIDSSGNVGIGISTITSFAGGSNRTLEIYNSSGANTEIRLINTTTGTGSTSGGLIQQAGNDLYIWNGSNSFMAFGTNNAEQMRITSGGSLLVGTTTATVSPAVGCQLLNGGLGQIAIGHDTSAVSGNYYASFAYNSGVIGSITQSGTTAVLYNVTSDQRLKENIQDADSASALIDSLQVRKFDWKTDNTHQRYGFVAQELVTVAPEAVHQPVNEEDMMAVDYSKLVPMLVKEIQSLRKRLADAGIA